MQVSLGNEKKIVCDTINAGVVVYRLVYVYGC